MFGGEILRVPAATRKNTCLTIYIVRLGYYWIFESKHLKSLSDLQCFFFLSRAKMALRVHRAHQGCLDFK